MKPLLCLAFIALGCGIAKASPVPEIAYFNFNPLGGIQAFAEPSFLEPLVREGFNFGNIESVLRGLGGGDGGFFGGPIGGGIGSGLGGDGGGFDGPIGGGIGGNIGGGIGSGLGGDLGFGGGLGGGSVIGGGLGGGPLGGGPLGGGPLDGGPLDGGDDLPVDSDSASISVDVSDGGALNPGFSFGLLPSLSDDGEDDNGGLGILPEGGDDSAADGDAGDRGFGFGGGLIPGGEGAADGYSGSGDEAYSGGPGGDAYSGSDDEDSDSDDGDIDDDNSGIGLADLAGLDALASASLPDLSLGNASLPSLPEDFSLGNFSLPDDFSLGNITLPGGGIPDGFGDDYQIGDYTPMDDSSDPGFDDIDGSDSGFAASSVDVSGASAETMSAVSGASAVSVPAADKSAAKGDKKDGSKKKDKKDMKDSADSGLL